MENELRKKLTCKDVFHWINRAFGTFLFVFFMMSSIIIFTTGMRYAQWFLPLFVIPACMVSITFGADYWVGQDPVRMRSYWISGIVAVILLLPASLYSMPYDVSMPLLRMIAAVLLSFVPILYGIRKARKKNATDTEIAATEKVIQSQRTHSALRKTIRVICLLSISCVLLESGHRVITLLSHFFVCLPECIVFAVFVPFPLCILSAILLARFMKAECVQRNPSRD